MQKVILQYGKAAFLLAAVFSVFCFMNTAHCQQYVIAGKDNTRPEVTKEPGTTAGITSFSALPFHGYNEIYFSALNEQDTRRYIVEYSADGVNYQSAGEVLSGEGVYSLKHYTSDNRSFLYRIRMEKNNGRFYHTPSFLMEAVNYPPVKVYPTIVETSVLNVQMAFPVQRIALVAADGRQVFTKQIGGQSGFMQVTIPTVGKGIYFMVFYGNGWKSSEKVMVAR